MEGWGDEKEETTAMEERVPWRDGAIRKRRQWPWRKEGFPSFSSIRVLG